MAYTASKHNFELCKMSVLISSDKNGSKIVQNSHRRLCQVRIQQRNYRKFVAEKIRRGLSLNRPDASLVDQIEENLRVSTEVHNRIVQSNLRLVVALARKFSGTIDQLSELVSEGTLPLIRAVKLFDVSRG
jgi:DNA-directed RNA polymerase sigma subunit (sigma70/sigma32)